MARTTGAPLLVYTRGGAPSPFPLPPDQDLGHNRADSMAEDEDSLERAIAGALRDAIKSHGPITPDKIGSAVKRIVGNLRNAQIGSLARQLGRRRFAGMSEKEKSAHQSAAASSRWEAMTPEERSAEMSRRRKKGWKTQKRKAGNTGA